ncbi:hypothetical protein CONPUDRAFT_83494 [Coniophora puteana RWD-64-598 SS2]|uniref:Uncharacterized protein n=1 Tax=Coniophora puteana (strain RWD-64-598) TaxID=741705 RepID=A0A5M3MKX2_CONPW|nr:uncharacterized protein CONPUDRAFT_83494 [Coniophora puteana RWD-64-598 SS2]EIW79211.1 hypothetical protein CONPUDRAFT_83494 [Coniophora puteana RWD-64-598 SS2]
MGNYSMLTSSAPAAPFGYAEAKPIQGLVSSYGLHPIDVRFPIMLASPSSRISHSHSPACESYNFDPDQQSSHEQHVGHRRARRRHIEEWKSIQDTTIMATGTSIFIPQKIYKPHTVADQRRCIEEAELMGYIAFENQHPRESGVPLIDALRSSCKHLIDKEDVVFEGEGPSVSIRIQWPGYASWTRQIPTKDFRTPKQPITREKLAKNIANCVKRFIEGMEKKPMEDDEDPKWRVGGRNSIKLEDLILVSVHHVSQGSWQPQLRMRRPL